MSRWCSNQLSYAPVAAECTRPRRRMQGVARGFSPQNAPELMLTANFREFPPLSVPAIPNRGPVKKILQSRPQSAMLPRPARRNSRGPVRVISGGACAAIAGRGARDESEVLRGGGAPRFRGAESSQKAATARPDQTNDAETNERTEYAKSARTTEAARAATSTCCRAPRARSATPFFPRDSRAKHRRRTSRRPRNLSRTRSPVAPRLIRRRALRRGGTTRRARGARRE